MIIDWLGLTPDYFVGGFNTPWGVGSSETGAGIETHRMRTHIRRTVRWRFYL